MGGGAVLKLVLKWVNQLLSLMYIWLISHKCIYVPSLKLFLVFRFSLCPMPKATEFNIYFYHTEEPTNFSLSFSFPTHWFIMHWIPRSQLN